MLRQPVKRLEEDVSEGHLSETPWLYKSQIVKQIWSIQNQVRQHKLES